VSRFARLAFPPDFSSEYAAGDDLADLFDVAVFDQKRGFRRLVLHDFLASDPNAVERIVLVLKSAPQTPSEFRFTVKYFQEGKGLDYYEFETEPVGCAPNEAALKPCEAPCPPTDAARYAAASSP
jgi:hypothetical protein